MDFQEWMRDQHCKCSEKQKALLGHPTNKNWKVELNYWLGRRDLLWALEDELKRNSLGASSKQPQ